jgi:hypothetical protein
LNSPWLHLIKMVNLIKTFFIIISLLACSVKSRPNNAVFIACDIQIKMYCLI